MHQGLANEVSEIKLDIFFYIGRIFSLTYVLLFFYSNLPAVAAVAAVAAPCNDKKDWSGGPIVDLSYLVSALQLRAPGVAFHLLNAFRNG